MGKKWKRDTNLESLKPEELDKVYQNVADAVSWLYKTVRERKIKEILDEIHQKKFNHQ
ncbi:MAG: hypothetical protein HYT09_02935 [Candidatus Levybacteria bacterium]|nr:hypothetical protein [Candidatus Levybacteria bacterium]